MSTVTPAIEARQSRKCFGHNEALATLGLIVPRGAIFALVGHNGAGKTTFLKRLLNMIEPTSGSATVLGKAASTLTGAAFTHIG